MKQPRLCLINVVNKSFFAEDPPLNIIFLASYLIQKRVLSRKNIRIVDAFIEDPLEAVQEFKPDIIGLSVMTPFYHAARIKAAQIRKISKAPIIIGGYHISALPQSLEEPFDIGVVGEGEEILTKLIRLWQQHGAFPTDELATMKGIVFFEKSGKVTQTERHAILHPNDFVPLDWTVIPKERVGHYTVFPVRGKPTILRTTRIFTARGCPYNCSFCAHRVIATGVRFYPINVVGEEIEYLYTHHGINCFQIMDDTFAVSKLRLKQLTEELERRGLLGKVFFTYLFVRANLIDEEYAQLLQKFGALSVFFGVESGSPRVLKWLKDGPFSVEDITRSAKLFNKYGISFFASFMLFSPDETVSDLEKSFKLATWLTAQPNALLLGYSVTTPYPGTKLWHMAVARKIINTQAINWKDFLMFDLRTSERKMTPVFFKHTISPASRAKYWSKFEKLGNVLFDRLYALPEWQKKQDDVHKLNNQEVAMIFTRRRFAHLAKRPLSMVKKIMSKPDAFNKFVHDLQMSTHMIQQ